MRIHFFIVTASISLLSGCAYIDGRANHTVSTAEGNVDVGAGPQNNTFTKSPSQKATEGAAKIISPVE